MKAIFNIITNYTYNNKVLLEIELSKIKDKKLCIGFLFHLLSNMDEYEVTIDRQDIINILFTYDVSISEIEEDVNYFLDKMQQYSVDNNYPGKLEIVDKCLNFLDWLDQFPVDNQRLSKNKEICDKILSLDKEVIDYLKDILIKNEDYEVVLDIDKIRNGI